MIKQSSYSNLTIEGVETLLIIAKSIYVEDDIVEDIPQLNAKSKSSVVSILNSVSSVVYGNELYPTLERKAAFIFYSFIKNHPLVNGNKRMAIVCSTVFLIINLLNNSNEKDQVVNTDFLKDEYFYKLALDVEKKERVENVDHKAVLDFLELEFEKFVNSVLN